MLETEYKDLYQQIHFDSMRLLEVHNGNSYHYTLRKSGIYWEQSLFAYKVKGNPELFQVEIEVWDRYPLFDSLCMYFIYFLYYLLEA